MKPITQEQLRAAGFSGVESYRDETALRLLCAFNGVDPTHAPPAWWAHPNASSRAAWKRVADEAQRIYGPATGKANLRTNNEDADKSAFGALVEGAREWAKRIDQWDKFRLATQYGPVYVTISRSDPFPDDFPEIP